MMTISDCDRIRDGEVRCRVVRLFRAPSTRLITAVSRAEWPGVRRARRGAAGQNTADFKTHAQPASLRARWRRQGRWHNDAGFKMAPRTTTSRSSPAAQAGLPLAPPRTWGGARAGAGRKRGQRVRHVDRPTIGRGLPSHVTLRVAPGLPSLRRGSTFQAIRAALAESRDRPGFRVVHFCVMRNHLHLIVEAMSADVLSRGVQALSIRIARAVNRALRREGPLFADRFHARTLRTPREVRNALLYVLQNYRRHAEEDARRAGGILDPTWFDPCSSAAWFDGWREPPEGSPPPGDPPVSPPTFWLLTRGWRRHGLLGVAEVPPAGA